jgi:transcriptional regulator with XRE-family HTH domain
MRLARLKAGVELEQAGIASKASRATVSNWENGRTSPSLEALRALTALYGVADGFLELNSDYELSALGAATEDAALERAAEQEALDAAAAGREHRSVKTLIAAVVDAAFWHRATGRSGPRGSSVGPTAAPPFAETFIAGGGTPRTHDSASAVTESVTRAASPRDLCYARRYQRGVDAVQELIRRHAPLSDDVGRALLKGYRRTDGEEVDAPSVAEQRLNETAVNSLAGLAADPARTPQGMWLSRLRALPGLGPLWPLVVLDAFEVARSREDAGRRGIGSLLKRLGSGPADALDSTSGATSSVRRSKARVGVVVNGSTAASDLSRFACNIDVGPVRSIEAGRLSSSANA